jgi:hypothetical protein
MHLRLVASSKTEVGRFDSSATLAKGMEGVRWEGEGQKQKEKPKTHQGHVALVGVHRDRSGVVGPPQRPFHLSEELIGGEDDRSHQGAFHRGARRHLIQTKLVLDQRQHPLLVEGGDDPDRGKITLSKPPKGVQ